jgi:hypothetical protein
MTVQTLHPALPPTSLQPDPQPERLEGVQLQEQVMGPLPRRDERTAAEVLSERLAESGPVAHATAMFVP